MTVTEFKKSLNETHPPKRLPPLVQALWYEAKDNWEEAHKVTQNQEGMDAAWVHAHLHRKEGDISNAHYWYSRAKKDTSHLTFEQEWDEIVRSFLG